MDYVYEIIKTWYPVVSGIIGTFAVIASITPNRADNAVADVLVRVINFLGANFGNARNEVD